jgi:hypothetical protein
MDWSPTLSPHRAFRESGSSDKPNQGFGQATDPNTNPFWFKVPPAPVNPAQRLRNPPKPSLLRSKPVEKGDIYFQPSTSATSGVMASKWDEAERRVSFAQPTFFPQQSFNDPRNSLADMLSQSFTLGKEDEDENGGTVGAREISRCRARTPNTESQLRYLPLLEAVILALLLASVMHIVPTKEPYSFHVSMAAIGSSTLVAFRLIISHIRHFSRSQSIPLTAIGGLVICIGELIASCYLGSQIWLNSDDVAYFLGASTCLIGMIAVQQVWVSIS